MALRRGFTLAEMMMTIAVMAIVLGMVARPASAYLSHSRANNAATVVAGDLNLARSIAMRQAQPVRLVFNEQEGSYSLSDRSGAVFRTRVLGATGDYQLTNIQFTPATLDVFPNGVVSEALTVTLGRSGYSRTVTMSRVGTVRAP